VKENVATVGSLGRAVAGEGAEAVAGKPGCFGDRFPHNISFACSLYHLEDQTRGCSTQ